MSLDSKLISGLYTVDSLETSDRLRLLLAVNHRFSSVGRTVFDFIVSHNDKYAKLPDKTTVEEKYPVFKFADLGEPYLFYLEEAIKWKKVLHIQESLHKVETLLGEGDIFKAVSHYTLSAREFEHLDLRSADIPVKEKIDETLDKYIETRDSGLTTGLFTGFSFLDSATNGLSKGDFWILASRPKNYKTFTMCKIFANMSCNYEGNFLFFSKEMTKEQIQNRVLAIVGNFDYSLFREYKISNEALNGLKEKLLKFLGNMIIVGRDSKEDYDVSFVRSKIMEYSPKMVFIDGVYLFSKSPDWQDQTNATRSLREIAVSTDVPIIASTQFNKKKEVGYSDSYEQDATVLLGQERVLDEVTNKLTNKVRLSLLRVREAEDQTSSIFSIDFHSMRFVEGDVDTDDSAEIIVGALGDRNVL